MTTDSINCASENDASNLQAECLRPGTAQAKSNREPTGKSVGVLNKDRLRRSLTRMIAQLSGSAQGRAAIVGLLLIDHANRKTGRCFPSAETMAGEMHCHERTIRRGVEDLVKVGFIEPPRRRKLRRGAFGHNTYTFTEAAISGQVPQLDGREADMAQTDRNDDSQVTAQSTSSGLDSQPQRTNLSIASGQVSHDQRTAAPCKPEEEHNAGEGINSSEEETQKPSCFPPSEDGSAMPYLDKVGTTVIGHATGHQDTTMVDTAGHCDKQPMRDNGMAIAGDHSHPGGHGLTACASDVAGDVVAPVDVRHEVSSREACAPVAATDTASSVASGSLDTPPARAISTATGDERSITDTRQPDQDGASSSAAPVPAGGASRELSGQTGDAGPATVPATSGRVAQPSNAVQTLRTGLAKSSQTGSSSDTPFDAKQMAELGKCINKYDLDMTPLKNLSRHGI